jgi:Flp pilus assembly protein protease CpaA
VNQEIAAHVQEAPETGRSHNVVAVVFLVLTVIAAWIAFGTSLAMGWRVLAGIAAFGWGLVTWRARVQAKLIADFNARRRLRE